MLFSEHETNWHNFICIIIIVMMERFVLPVR